MFPRKNVQIVSSVHSACAINAAHKIVEHFPLQQIGTFRCRILLTENNKISYGFYQSVLTVDADADLLGDWRDP
jgi:hypothetical protein